MSHRKGDQCLRAPRWPSSRPVPFLKRCSSTPSGLFLKTVRGEGEGEGRSFDEGRVMFRGHTCTDVLAPCSSSPRGSEGYSKDAKVVVNVTVEGSPGPIRTMVRLGCSVEDAIVAVVDRYGQEGRTPRLDRDGVTGYELHHSYFSLQSLEKSEHIGDVGGRSFYLRTSSNNTVVLPGTGEAANPLPAIPPLCMFLTFIARKLGKIVREGHGSSGRSSSARDRGNRTRLPTSGIETLFKSRGSMPPEPIPKDHVYGGSFPI